MYDGVYLVRTFAYLCIVCAVHTAWHGESAQQGVFPADQAAEW